MKILLIYSRIIMKAKKKLNSHEKYKRNNNEERKPKKKKTNEVNCSFSCLCLSLIKYQ